MRDAELERLVSEAMGPFPAGLAGEEIEGVDVVMLDDTIMGIASHYERNSKRLTPTHAADLRSCLSELDAIWFQLANDEARDYFSRARRVARYLVAKRM